MDMNSILSKAQKLMLDPGFNAAVESKAAAFAGRKSGNGSNVNDLRMFEAQAFGTPIKSNDIEYLTEAPQQRNPAQTKFPKSVIESFKETPVMTNVEVGNYVPQSYFASGNAVPQQQYVPQVPQSQIDYNYIKHLVSEAIKENISGLLTESNNSAPLKGMRIYNGNTIQFIDSKGNLYEGTLKLKKRAEK